jgi:hypothetical protein
MPYIKTTYDLGKTKEVEKVFSSRFGKKGKRGERKAPTTDEMKKINERNAVKKLRRKIARNFEPGDLHIVLTYKGEPPEQQEAAGCLTKFLRRLKSWYRKAGEDLKYIKVTEYKRKRVHHHIVINEIEGILKKLRELWKGGIYPSSLYEEGGYDGLAEYLVKETKKSREDKDAPGKLRYSCSRNLIEPEKHTEIIHSKKWRETPVPPQGYFIPKDSVVNVENEETGHKYQYYTLVPADRAKNQKDYIRPRQRKKTSCRSG